MSTKLGKSSGELKVARENQFLRKSVMAESLPRKRTQRSRQQTESELEQTFLDSLICNVEYVPSCCWCRFSLEFGFFVHSAWFFTLGSVALLCA